MPVTVKCSACSAHLQQYRRDCSGTCHAVCRVQCAVFDVFLAVCAVMSHASMFKGSTPAAVHIHKLVNADHCTLHC
jgi:hypothetical protein